MSFLHRVLQTPSACCEAAFCPDCQRRGPSRTDRRSRTRVPDRRAQAPPSGETALSRRNPLPGAGRGLATDPERIAGSADPSLEAAFLVGRRDRPARVLSGSTFSRLLPPTPACGTSLSCSLGPGALTEKEGTISC